jgi:hypothetical protein
MVYSNTKNANFGIFLKGMEIYDAFHGHFGTLIAIVLYFWAIWYFFGNFHLGIRV